MMELFCESRSLIKALNSAINALLLWHSYPKFNKIPAGIYLLKVNNRNTRTRCEICLKLTIKIPERRQTTVSASSVWRHKLPISSYVKYNKSRNFTGSCSFWKNLKNILVVFWFHRFYFLLWACISKKN